ASWRWFNSRIQRPKTSAWNRSTKVWTASASPRRQRRTSTASSDNTSDNRRQEFLKENTRRKGREFHAESGSGATGERYYAIRGENSTAVRQWLSPRPPILVTSRQASVASCNRSITSSTDTSLSRLPRSLRVSENLMAICCIDSCVSCEPPTRRKSSF